MTTATAHAVTREDWSWTARPTVQTGWGLALAHHYGEVQFNVPLGRVIVRAEYQMRRDNYAMWATSPTLNVTYFDLQLRTGWRGSTTILLNQGQSSWQSMRSYIIKEAQDYCNQTF